MIREQNGSSKFVEFLRLNGYLRFRPLLPDWSWTRTLSINRPRKPGSLDNLSESYDEESRSEQERSRCRYSHIVGRQLDSLRINMNRKETVFGRDSLFHIADLPRHTLSKRQRTILSNRSFYEWTMILLSRLLSPTAMAPPRETRVRTVIMVTSASRPTKIKIQPANHKVRVELLSTKTMFSFRIPKEKKVNHLTEQAQALQVDSYRSKVLAKWSHLHRAIDSDQYLIVPELLSVICEEEKKRYDAYPDLFDFLSKSWPFSFSLSLSCSFSPSERDQLE